MRIPGPKSILGAGGLTLGIGHALSSREKKKAKQRVDEFKSDEVKDWDRFTNHAARKSFVQQLGSDPTTDPKLLQYADSMNRLKTGSKITSLPGDAGKSYQISKLRGSERLGCTCNDWRYKRSVAQPGEEQDCKHIKQYRQMSKTAALASLKPEKSKEIFHGSPTEITKFEGRPHYLADNEPVVFGTPSRGMALTHLARWNDNDFEQYRINDGPLTMREQYPGALEKIYRGKKGYIYKLDPESFEHSPRLTRSERISKANPPILGTEEILDVLKALEESDVRLIRAKTYGETKKEAGHVEDRIAERAPGAEAEVNTLRSKLRKMQLRKGQTYHIPLKRGRGYAVIGDVGDHHAVKTVLGPNMRPPGERLKLARAPRDYAKEYREYHAKPEQVENRSLRNQARRKIGLKKGDPREADHKTPLSKGGGNGHSNLRAVSLKTNRTKFTGES